jgi:hypothetical protein
MLALLEGRWHVLETTFPMWLSGKRAKPAFTYTRAARNGLEVLDDDVSFIDVATGREKHIRGVDVPAADDERAFVWRGKGLLAIATSRWRVIEVAPQGDWAVIAFSRTLFTPAGLDVIARSPAPLDAAARAAVHAVIAADPTVAPLLSQLRALNTVHFR